MTLAGERVALTGDRDLGATGLFLTGEREADARRTGLLDVLTKRPCESRRRIGLGERPRCEAGVNREGGDERLGLRLRADMCE